MNITEVDGKWNVVEGPRKLTEGPLRVLAGPFKTNTEAWGRRITLTTTASGWRPRMIIPRFQCGSRCA
jgi:hypothetical protein